MNKIILIVVVLLAIGSLAYVFTNKYTIVSKNEPNPPPANNKNTNTVTIPRGLSLDLRNQGLEKIPSYVFDKTDLLELDVSSNALTGAIQSQIGQLKNLKILNASNNQMTGVPAEVGQLKNLQVLDLSNNQLTGLPNELGNLTNLKILNLSGNNYSTQDLAGIRAKLPSTVNIILQ